MRNHVAQLSFAKTTADAQPDPGGDLAGGMRKSGSTAVCLTHAINYCRTPQLGDWYQYHLQLLAYDDRLLAANGLQRALTVSDLRAAHRARAPVVIQGSDDGQWIEGRILPTLKDYVSAIRQMADVVGVDHTGIGTDTSLLPPPPPNPTGLPLTNKTWPDQTSEFVYSLAHEMRNQGFRPDEISKIAGGTYVRLFGVATSSRG